VSVRIAYSGEQTIFSIELVVGRSVASHSSDDSTCAVETHSSGCLAPELVLLAVIGAGAGEKK